VLADETGVVVVPQDRIREAIDLAGKIMTQEALLEAQVVNDAVSSWDEI
jgi:regulator of RNase E activity RraA